METASKQDGEVLVFTCAGAAYPGQACNQAGVQIQRGKIGNLYCIAAVAAKREVKLERTQAAGTRVALDGCEDECCKRILESAGFPVEIHVVATDLGIEKKPETPRLGEDSAKIVERVREALER